MDYPLIVNDRRKKVKFFLEPLGLLKNSSDQNQREWEKKIYRCTDPESTGQQFLNYFNTFFLMNMPKKEGKIVKYFLQNESSWTIFTSQLMKEQYPQFRIWIARLFANSTHKLKKFYDWLIRFRIKYYFTIYSTASSLL